MTPRKVTATGIKTGGIQIDLMPLTIVTGDNGSGKTAIADAIKLALLGRHPVLGSRGAEIMKLSNGDVLEVTVDDVRRTWTRKGKTVSHESNEAAGKIPAFPEVIIDFETFLQAKPTARREILEAALPGVNVTEILQEIHLRLTADGLAEMFETTPAGFVNLTKEAAERGKNWKQEATRLKGAIQSAEIEISELPAITSDSVPSVESFADARGEILKAQGANAEKVEALLKRRNESSPEPTEKRPIAEDIEAAELSVARAAEVKDANTEIRMRIGIVRRRDVPEIVTDLNATIDDLKDDRDALMIAQGKHVTRHDDLQGRKLELESTPACPTCGTCGPKLDEAIEVLILAPMANLELDMKTAKDAIDKVVAEIAEWEGKKTVALEEWSEAREAEIANLEAEIDFEGEISAGDNPVRLERLALDWVKFENSKPPTDEERKEALGESADLVTKLADLDARIDQSFARQKHDEKVANLHGGLKSSKAELEAASANVKTLKALGDWSKVRSLEITAERLKPLLDPANSILAGVVEGSLHVEGTNVGLLSPIGPSFRPIEVLSGAESAAVAAAIQVALASNSEVSFVIIDELSRLTLRRKRSLMGNLHDAIQSKLVDGVLVLDHDEDFAEGFAESPDVLVYTV